MARPFWWLWGCIAQHLAGEFPCEGKPSHRAQLLQCLWLGHQPCSHHPGTRDATSTFKGHHGTKHFALSIKTTLTRDGNQALRWTGLVCRLSLSSRLLPAWLQRGRSQPVCISSLATFNLPTCFQPFLQPLLSQQALQQAPKSQRKSVTPLPDPVGWGAWQLPLRTAGRGRCLHWFQAGFCSIYSSTATLPQRFSHKTDETTH